MGAVGGRGGGVAHPMPNGSFDGSITTVSVPTTIVEVVVAVKHGYVKVEPPGRTVKLDSVGTGGCGWLVRNGFGGGVRHPMPNCFVGSRTMVSVPATMVEVVVSVKQGYVNVEPPGRTVNLDSVGTGPGGGLVKKGLGGGVAQPMPNCMVGSITMVSVPRIIVDVVVSVKQGKVNVEPPGSSVTLGPNVGWTGGGVGGGGGKTVKVTPPSVMVVGDVTEGKVNGGLPGRLVTTGPTTAPPSVEVGGGVG